MSKVLVDRELLENLVALWNLKGGGRTGSPNHCHSKPGIWDQGNREGISGMPCAECAMYDAARALVTQPAEAEGVELRRYTPISQGDHMPAMNSCDQGGWVRHADHLAAIAAVTAELGEIKDSMAFRSSRIGRVEAERDQLRAEVEGLRPIHAMILNALDRDAEEGKTARGEMAAELRAALAAKES